MSSTSAIRRVDPLLVVAVLAFVVTSSTAQTGGTRERFTAFAVDLEVPGRG